MCNASSVIIWKWRQIKTLEAISRGLPVIGTDYAFEGIDMIHPIHGILENNIDNYPEIMKNS